MNAPSKKPKAAETVEDVLGDMDRKREANLRIWSTLGKTDPKHTKGFSRAGGFSGTAIKPIWITQRLTEMFGPCGIGWGFEVPQFKLVEAAGEILVYCTATAWYIDGGTQHFVYGVGGDKVLTQRKSGPFCDDEAFKKAFTDALGNAFKFIGVGADVHIGLFEDSKYLAEVNAEFHPPANPKTDETPPAKRVKLDGPYTSKTALWGAVKAFVHAGNGMGDLGEWIAYRDSKEVQELIAQCKRDAPALWSEGLPDVPEYEPLVIFIARRTRELEQLESMGVR
jgi:hypothetical protein